MMAIRVALYVHNHSRSSEKSRVLFGELVALTSGVWPVYACGIVNYLNNRSQQANIPISVTLRKELHLVILSAPFVENHEQ